MTRPGPETGTDELTDPEGRPAPSAEADRPTEADPLTEPDAFPGVGALTEPDMPPGFGMLTEPVARPGAEAEPPVAGLAETDADDGAETDAEALIVPLVRPGPETGETLPAEPPNGGVETGAEPLTEPVGLPAAARPLPSASPGLSPSGRLELSGLAGPSDPSESPELDGFAEAGDHSAPGAGGGGGA